MTARSWKFESSSGHQIQSLRLVQLLSSHKNPRKRVFAFQVFDFIPSIRFIKTKTGVYRSKLSPYSSPHQQRENVVDTAQMVKLVDTPASGAGDRKVVEVRVFFWAPIQASAFHAGVSQKPAKAGFCISGFLICKTAYTSSASPPHFPPRQSSGIHPHLRNNIVYYCYKFLQCDREEPCE